MEVPASREMLEAANRHAHFIFGTDALSFDQVADWNEKNPFVTAIPRSQWGIIWDISMFCL